MWCRGAGGRVPLREGGGAGMEGPPWGGELFGKLCRDHRLAGKGSGLARDWLRPPCGRRYSTAPIDIGLLYGVGSTEVWGLLCSRNVVTLVFPGYL